MTTADSGVWNSLRKKLFVHVYAVWQHKLSNYNSHQLWPSGSWRGERPWEIHCSVTNYYTQHCTNATSGSSDQDPVLTHPPCSNLNCWILILNPEEKKSTGDKINSDIGWFPTKSKAKARFSRTLITRRESITMHAAKVMLLRLSVNAWLSYQEVSRQLLVFKGQAGSQSRCSILDSL